MPRKGPSKGKGTHRGRGEGSVFQRADGKWVAMLPPDRETRKRKTYVGDTRAEVHARLMAALHDREQGLPVLVARQTVAQYLASWLETMRPPRTSRNTAATYERIVRMHLLPALGRTQLAALTAQQVQRLYATKAQEGYASVTVRAIHATLHRALEAAVRLGLVPRNVADLVEKPRVSKREMRVWTIAQAQRFLEAVRGDDFEAFYVLALTTGMRQSELLGLLWRNVDLDVGRLHVLTQLQRRTDLAAGFALVAPKTEAGRRVIKLSRLAAEALRERQALQQRQRTEALGHYQEHHLVFADALGMPVHRAASYMRFRRLVETLDDLPPIRLHDLRHTAATILLSRAVNVKVISEMLGHSSVSITMNVYAHLLPDMQQQATAAMDAVFTAQQMPGRVVDAVGVREVAEDE